MLKRLLSPLCLSVLVLFAGCAEVSKQENVSDSSSSGGGFSNSGPRRVEALAMADANRQSVTDLDVVFIYDPTLSDRMPTLADNWFTNRDSLQQIAGKLMEVVSVELPPSFAAGPLPLPQRADKALRVLAYARYQSPEGQAVIDLTQRRQVELRLQRESVALAPR